MNQVTKTQAAREESDLDAQVRDLRAENALLTGELLRLRLAGVRLAPTGVAEPLTTLSAEQAPSAPAAADSEQLLQDMRWLLARLSESPLGFAFRRRDGFRALYERYGADS